MYIVKIYNDGVPLEIQNESQKVKSGNVVKGINAIDSFSLTLLPNNPGFTRIRDKKTLVTVYNTNKKRFEFHGRALYSAPSMDSNGLITKAVTCESFFGFLCDSEQTYVEERNWTVRGFLEHLINTHNSQVEDYKHFVVGEVSSDLDPNNNLYVGIQRKKTWETIKEKLLDKLGGEIRFRVVDDVIYIDYLTKIGAIRSTAIELSRNMKSITQENDPTAYVTRFKPLGCKLTKEVTSTDEEGNETTETVETEERLNISSVNNGLDYIVDEEAERVYGINVHSETFDDITTASNLFTRGQQWLEENNRVKVKYSISALDLSLLGLDIDDFDVHNYHPIINPLLGIDDTARIIKKNIDICNETSSTIEIGDNFKTFSDIQLEQSGRVDNIENTVGKIEKDYVTNEQLISESRDMRSLIQQTVDNILLTVSETYESKSTSEEFRQSIESELSVLADQISMNFTTTTEQITNVDGDLQSKFTELHKYIKFSAGTAITIGSSDSAITLEIDNEKGIVFKKNGVQFGLWDGENFYTGNIVVEVNERAQFGNFAFVPRTDGSLSFLKVDGANVERPTLVSISATYSGGSVPTGTRLNSLTDITVTATYSDNSTETVDNYYLSGEINVGTNTITVSYGGKTTSFTVVGESLPNKLVSISANYSGGTVQLGTTLEELTGISVTALYSDGSTEPVTGYTLSGSIAPGSNTITVSYGGMTDTFTVYCESVAERTLESISATYSGGSVPVGTLVESLSGITVTAHWSDGSTSIVTDYNLSGSISEGENEVWVLYEGKIAIITVVGAASASNEITLGEKTTCVVKFWMSNTTSGSIVQYASDVRVVDGVVELVNPMQHTFYMVYSGVTNDYTVLLGKYVKSANGDIYFIDTDSTYTHNTNVTAYVAENIIYNSAHRADIA